MHFTHSSHSCTHGHFADRPQSTIKSLHNESNQFIPRIKNICNSSQNLFLFLKFNIYESLSCVKISSRQELLVRPQKQILCKINLSPVKWLPKMLKKPLHCLNKRDPSPYAENESTILCLDFSNGMHS